MGIYVDNLVGEVDEDDLRGIFEVYGRVESVNIPRDRQSGESKGFGFLKMPSTDEAQKAIREADGMDLKGKTIKVDEAHHCPVADSRRDSDVRGRAHRGCGNRRGAGEHQSRPR